MSERKIEVNLDTVFLLMKEKLENGAAISFSPKGISMLPLIRYGSDTVTLKSLTEPPKLYDIVFYRRDNKSFVLHRIIGIRNGKYTVCGDNQYIPEKNVDKRLFIAKVIRLERSGTAIPLCGKKYDFYCKTLFFKRLFLRLKNGYYITRIFSKLKK